MSDSSTPGGALRILMAIDPKAATILATFMSGKGITDEDMGGAMKDAAPLFFGSLE